MAGGQQINVGQGTLTATGDDVTEAATGEEATATAGDLGSKGNSVRLRSRKVGGGTATYALTGQTIPVSIGAVTPTPTKTPTSIAALFTAGDFGKTRSVTLTGEASTSAAGSVSAGSSGTNVAWQFGDAASINTGANTTTTLATGVPTGATYYASPDLLPGQTLSLSSGTLSLVGDTTVPTVNGDSSALDIISDRDICIEVMDSPYATIVNATTGTTYQPGTSYTTPDSAFPAGRWNKVMYDASQGDTIEISPGSVHESYSDLSNYYSNNLDSCGLTIVKSLTIRSMTGRGRWKVYPASGISFESNRNAIGIFSPGDVGSRLTVSLEGFDITDQFLTAGVGVRIRASALTASSWAGYHQALTLRNFKIGRTTGASLSGISGPAETMTIEDGHVFDCGNGSGQEHNFYISARTMTLRGLRSARTRGWSGTPWSGGTVGIEGHMAKLSAVTGTIEGCSFDCSGMADPSLMIQMKAGGNWTVRGNILIDASYPNVANGAITMCREMAADGVTPNYEWWAGSEGNSLLFEKNVFVGHYPRPIVWFFATTTGGAMQPASGGSYTTAERLQSLIVRDNVAMVATSALTAAADQWKISGWAAQDSTRALWIYRDPNAGASWTTRGNTVMTYGTDEPGFTKDERALKLYRRTAGTVAANAGTVSTYRFTWPHGYMARSDAYQGLG